jgi:hypothetical protein
VELTVTDHFAVSALVLHKGKGRDKWPTSGSLAKYNGIGAGLHEP